MINPNDVANGDTFDHFKENAVKKVSEEPVSTFSVDVNTVSYTYVRKTLQNYGFPNSDAVKVEEFINYFDYDYPTPTDSSVPFETSVAISDSPWNKGRKLMHIGIKGYDMDPTTRPYCNIVFLVDISGSMSAQNKLALAKDAIAMMLDTMQPNDLVSIVTYASNVNVPLPPTLVSNKNEILSVLRMLRASGATWGTGGIEKAYALAEENFDPDAVNRIMLVTDGDFNIGLMDRYSLQKYIAKKRETGIFLSCLGFGMGNYRDTTMQALANHGNGAAAYIDSMEEAHKVMVTEASSTIFPIAKDVKIQIEFNPTTVVEYRLVGYEKRILRREDFNNDKVDAGDIGSGHTVTAIYEITPVGSSEGLVMDELRYPTKNGVPDDEKPSDLLHQEHQELAFLKMRYKLPNEDTSKLISEPVTLHQHDARNLENPKLLQEFRFATAVASFAENLKNSGDNASSSTNMMSYEDIIQLAENNIGEDKFGYRRQFINLVRVAKGIVQESYLQTATI